MRLFCFLALLFSLVFLGAKDLHAAGCYDPYELTGVAAPTQQEIDKNEKTAQELIRLFAKNAVRSSKVKKRLENDPTLRKVLIKLMLEQYDTKDLKYEWFDGYLFNLFTKKEIYAALAYALNQTNISGFQKIWFIYTLNLKTCKFIKTYEWEADPCKGLRMFELVYRENIRILSCFLDDDTPGKLEETIYGGFPYPGMFNDFEPPVKFEDVYGDPVQCQYLTLRVKDSAFRMLNYALGEGNAIKDFTVCDSYEVRDARIKKMKAYLQAHMAEILAKYPSFKDEN